MFQPPRGTRDFMPGEMIVRQKVFDTLRNVFERFGYAPLDTPAFESKELLAAKGGGGEAIKQEIYWFKDKSNRELGLRFDLTVPTARVVSTKPEIPKPFKRYQTGPVWRYEEVKSGRRYREFWQCDVDVFGVSGMEAEAEALAVTCASLEALGFRGFYIRLNNRKILEGMIELAGVPEGKFLGACRALDKIEKFGIKAVQDEMCKAGVKPEQCRKILKFCEITGTNQAVLKKVRTLMKGNRKGMEGIEEIERILGLVKGYGISDKIRVDASLARGLDYYTGPIFEAVIKGGEETGSVAGGGRYDRLIELYGGKPTPATGISFGVERIAGILADSIGVKNRTKVFVVAVNDKVRKDVVELAQKLRESGVNSEIDLLGRNLRKQLDFVNANGIPFALIVGEQELKSKKFTLRNMNTGKESKLKMDGIVRKVSG